MSELIHRFKNFIEDHQLIRPYDQVLVAVSGGVDSVVLLHLLVQLIEPLNLKLQIIHLNHGLRGDQAERDQQFVEQLAKDYRIPIISRKVNVPGFVAKKGLSEEEGARILRYRFFNWALKKTATNCIALGHHADDQAETVIDHFLRGSGIKGLAGIPIRRGKFIRPLLCANRQEIETYARAHSLHYLTDATNIMVRYRRNRIRHELIPYLQQHFNPAIAKVALRSAKIMEEVEIYLNEQARLAFEDCLIQFKKNKIILDIDLFLDYFSIIQKYILYQLLDRLQLNRSIFTAQKFDQLLNLIRERISGKKIALTDKWNLRIDHNQIVILGDTIKDFQIPVEINKAYSLSDGELRFCTELITKQQLPRQFAADRHVEYVDYDQISGPLMIRNFRAGDRFRPLNVMGEKKLSDFFTDLKIPLHQRREIPLLVCDLGIIWIIGFQIDDRVKIADRTERILKLQIIEEPSE